MKFDVSPHSFCSKKEYCKNCAANNVTRTKNLHMIILCFPVLMHVASCEVKYNALEVYLNGRLASSSIKISGTVSRGEHYANAINEKLPAECINALAES